MEENKNFAMVRCEFEGREKVVVSGEIDCDALQLLIFAAEVLKAVAKELSLEPSKIAMLALLSEKLVSCVGDETENGEES